MAKTIPLTQGKVAVVDNRDFDFLSQWKWFAFKAGKTFYAIRNSSGRASGQVRMHALLLPPKNGKLPDHKDRDGLNNRRKNLRLATRSQNAANASKHKDNRSGFKGVSWNKSAKKWIATIGQNNRQIYLGLFECKIEAAKAYNRAARFLKGNFAALNDIFSHTK